MNDKTEIKYVVKLIGGKCDGWSVQAAPPESVLEHFQSHLATDNYTLDGNIGYLYDNIDDAMRAYTFAQQRHEIYEEIVDYETGGETLVSKRYDSVVMKKVIMQTEEMLNSNEKS